MRKQQMIEAALRLITDRGIEAATIDAIAETVGFSESDINRHFPANNRLFAN
jgi:AcrR family transcriptional regulator|tara:strand:+ start:688 stop:843 length:156 start_codon:yes stop_codon:yes gene_type:complete